MGHYMKVEGKLEGPYGFVHYVPSNHTIWVLGQMVLLAPSYTYLERLRIHIHKIGRFVKSTHVLGRL
jgi:hypothetical protein